MFELFLSKRYLISKHKLNFITIISILSTLGITIGVAALVIVLSVFNGFGGIVKSILINFDPHVRIQLLEQNNTKNHDSLYSILTAHEEIKTFNPYVEGKSYFVK